MSFDSRAKKRIREAKKKARPGKLIFKALVRKLGVPPARRQLRCKENKDHLVFLCKSISELNSSAAWVEQGYCKNFKPFTVFTDNVERISIEKTSPEEFIEQYEKPYKPVIHYIFFKFWCRLINMPYSELGCHS